MNRIEHMKSIALALSHSFAMLCTIRWWGRSSTGEPDPGLFAKRSSIASESIAQVLHIALAEAI